MRAESQSAGHNSNGPQSQGVSSNVPSSNVPASSDAGASDSTRTSLSVGQTLPLVKFFQCQDIVATRLSLAIDDAQAGDLVCFQTGLHDPVAFAAKALACGAAAVLTEQLLPCPLPQGIVGDVTDAACRISSGLQGNPSSQMLTIGVVGDSGKTSTAMMIAGLLKKIGIRTAYETDLGSSDGVIQSTPASGASAGVDLVNRLADARDAGCGAIVVEYSGSHPGAGGGIGLDMLVITGADSALSGGGESHFGPDSLAVAIDQAKPDAVIIAPADHGKWLRRIDDTGLRRLTYGLRRPADVSAKVFEDEPGETTLMVTSGDETAAMQTRHCGEAMAMNSLAAISVGLLLETPLHTAIRAVTELPMVPGRMHRLTGFDTAAVVIDAAGTADRLAGTLRSLRRQRRSGGKVWCLLAIGDSAATDRPHESAETDEPLARMGRVVERFADRIVLTSTESAKATFLRSSHAVLDGFKDVAVARLVADPVKAIRWAVRHADPRDTVLIVTGDESRSASQSRRLVQRIESQVDSARQDPDVKRQEYPATIKMF